MEDLQLMAETAVAWDLLEVAFVELYTVQTFHWPFFKTNIAGFL